MSTVNKAIILGRAGRDPEIRYTASGEVVCNLSLATSTRRKDRNTGEMLEDTQWHRVTLYGRQAEVAGEYIKKGHLVYVEGRLKYGKYTDQSGVEKPTCDIIANELKLMGGQGEQGGGRQGQQAAPAARPRSQAPAPAPARQSSGFDDMDDGIPF